MVVFIDYNKLTENIGIFKHYVLSNEEKRGVHSDTFSFTEPGSWLYDQEYYKYQVYTKTFSTMDYMTWEEKEIGSGRIAKSVQKAVNCCGNDNNLINRYNKMHFNNQYTDQTDFIALDRAFFDLYCGNDDQKAFNKLTEIFGRRYDIIAFLFFIRNPDIYLPISPDNFDKGFERLGIRFSTSHNCSWNNYSAYNEIFREIQAVLNESLPLRTPASLLDTHSFVWIVSHDFYGWTPDAQQNQ